MANISAIIYRPVFLFIKTCIVACCCFAIQRYRQVDAATGAMK